MAGDAFASVVAERVLRPAGMAGAAYPRLDEAVPDFAVGYPPRTDEAAPWRSNVFSIPVIGGGDGGAVATARAVDTFLRAIASGSLLGDELSTEMRSRHVAISDDVWTGYGVMVRPDGFGHGGGDPGVETLGRHLHVDDLSLVVLCNGEGMLGEAWRLVTSALEA